MNIKKWIDFLGYIVFIIVLASFNKVVSDDEEITLSKKEIANQATFVSYPKLESKYNNDSNNNIFLKKDYQGFKEALAYKESQGNYTTINTLGYIGKYQFGSNTLKLLGVHSLENFKCDPILQEKVFELNVSRNKWILRRYIKTFVGKRINGTIITESGMIAAAHLAGAGNVKKYLKTYGKQDFADAYGTDMKYYLKKFKNYDISDVKPEHNPKI